MNVFLREFSEEYPDDTISFVTDGAAWHKAKGLVVPKNIELFPLPPYTAEMNPIEQIWKELRKRGFKNETFATLEHVVDRLCGSKLEPNPTSYSGSASHVRVPHGMFLFGIGECAFNGLLFRFM